MRVLRVFADSLGVARVEWRTVPLETCPDGRSQSSLYAARHFFFRESPAGHVNTRHRAPRRQFIFVASGIGAIELDDGSRHRFQPGDIIFAENVAGLGHVTHSLEGIRGFVYLSVPEEFDIAAWPLIEPA
jgi:quercetin dioxygenase-like cupin family protein